MRISTKGRYSLEALLYMALLPEGEYSNTKVIAEGTGVSDGYLEQIFIPLRKAGILQGIRGPLGGYTLTRPLEQIRVGEILRAAEGSLEPVACVNSEDCPDEGTCISHHTWSDLYGAITRCVDSIALSDLAAAYRSADTQEYTI